MLRIRKKVSRHVYQYSSFSRNLNPIKHARLTLQQIELVSYRDAHGGVEPNWQINMNTGIRAITIMMLHHLSNKTKRVVIKTGRHTVRTLRVSATTCYQLALTVLRHFGSVCISTMRALVAIVTVTGRLIVGRLLGISEAITKSVQKLNPKPLVQKGTVVTHKVAQLAGSGREYLTENIATTILICFLVFVSSFMAYQTLAYYVARIIG